MLLHLTSLVVRRQRGSGRNHTGSISVWGRHSRAVTQVAGGLALDYWFGFVRVWQTCLSGWFNHRAPHVGFVVDDRGTLGYLRLSSGVNRGDYVQATATACFPRNGYTLPLRWVPVGIQVNSVNFYGRSPGVSLKVLRHRNNFTECRLPSRKTCWINSLTFCRVGFQGNPLVHHLSYRSAGQTFWLGRRPHVRGVAMNPIDHPHGGGQGKTSGGRPGVTPWGRLTKGAKTVRKMSLVSRYRG